MTKSELVLMPILLCTITKIEYSLVCRRLTMNTSLLKYVLYTYTLLLVAILKIVFYETYLQITFSYTPLPLDAINYSHTQSHIQVY